MLDAVAGQPVAPVTPHRGLEERLERHRADGDAPGDFGAHAPPRDLRPQAVDGLLALAGHHPREARVGAHRHADAHEQGKRLPHAHRAHHHRQVGGLFGPAGLDLVACVAEPRAGQPAHFQTLAEGPTAVGVERGQRRPQPAALVGLLAAGEGVVGPARAVRDGHAGDPAPRPRVASDPARLRLALVARARIGCALEGDQVAAAPHTQQRRRCRLVQRHREATRAHQVRPPRGAALVAAAPGVSLPVHADALPAGGRAGRLAAPVSVGSHERYVLAAEHHARAGRRVHEARADAVQRARQGARTHCGQRACQRLFARLARGAHGHHERQQRRVRVLAVAVLVVGAVGEGGTVTCPGSLLGVPPEPYRWHGARNPVVPRGRGRLRGWRRPRVVDWPHLLARSAARHSSGDCPSAIQVRRVSDHNLL